MTVPEPPQREHRRGMENRPWPCDSTPRPWQTGHTIGSVPGSAPVPRQVGHGVKLVTATGTWAPVTDWANQIGPSVSRSRPFSVCGFVRGCPAPPAPPPPPPKRPVAWPKRSDRMSEKPPTSGPAAPPPGPPNGEQPEKTEPPRSYFLRLSASERTS